MNTPESYSNDTRQRRKTHKKSRRGCEKCKARRIKCDELNPKCSRCIKFGLACQYPRLNRPPTIENNVNPESALQLQISQSLLAIAQSHLSFNLLMDDQEATPILQMGPAQLPTPESALLQHYLEHTSHDMTVDDGDQYALQIGIPNLALQSKPLMKSELAFSAICKCHDNIKQSSISFADRTQILDLLSTADRYHMESLREIQPALSKVEFYDHVLANAALMGMYGSGSHCVRIWLTETAAPNDPMLKTFMPKSCQWISWFRAVRVAYESLVKEKPSTDDNGQYMSVPSPVDAPGPSNKQPPESQSHDHPLYPILAVTMSSARTRLEEKVNRIARGIIETQTHGEAIDGDDKKESDSHAAIDLQACLDALELLKSVITETFTSKYQTPSTSGLYRQFGPVTDSEEQPSIISPWMQRYTANITSMNPSKLPRRFIMAFIHKAPTRYLELVEHMMDFILNEADGCWEPISSEPKPGCQLAIEIFAHWLVLVLMLDGVWWIGGTGAWELKHIVAAKRNARWRACLWNTGEDWWPESMLEIDIQLGKYREKILFK